MKGLPYGVVMPRALNAAILTRIVGSWATSTRHDNALGSQRFPCACPRSFMLFSGKHDWMQPLEEFGAPENISKRSHI